MLCECERASVKFSFILVIPFDSVLFCHVPLVLVRQLLLFYVLFVLPTSLMAYFLFWCVRYMGASKKPSPITSKRMK